VVLGVSFDSPEEQLAFAKKHAFTFRLLSDRGRKIGMDYRACKTPQDKYAARYTYVIGPDGRIREALVTADPGAQADDLLRRLK
jgi:peroxiredoxin Q/BCP